MPGLWAERDTPRAASECRTPSPAKAGGKNFRAHEGVAPMGAARRRVLQSVRINAPNPKSETVLIAGASSGIGYELAREFAKHGHPLAIVAPLAAELELAAATLEREFGVMAWPLAHDLMKEDAPEEILDRLAREGRQVDILVNSAGLARRGKFWVNPAGRDIEMIRLNVEVDVRLTRLFLPPMLERRHGRILNTASVAGFDPGPNLAVYHATKAFVLSLSESLATELEGTGVTLTALCPGPTDTDFFPKADMVDTPAFQRANVMGPHPVAEAAYAGLMKGERLVVPGALNKAMVASRRILPESAQAKMNEKLYTQTSPRKRKRERAKWRRWRKRNAPDAAGEDAAAPAHDVAREAGAGISRHDRTRAVP
jgi:short-subunit dehydrogenase